MTQSNTDLVWFDLTAITDGELKSLATALLTARTRFEGAVKAKHPEAMFSYKRGQSSYGIKPAPAPVAKPAANGKAGKSVTPDQLAAMIAKAVAAAMAAQGL